MTRHCAWVFLAAWLGAASASAAPCEHAQQRSDDPKKTAKTEVKPEAPKPDNPPRWKWWVNADSRKELRLTEQQAKQIDQIFEAGMPKQRDRWHELETLEDQLAKTIKENTADVATVTQQVEKVEKLRAEVVSARTVMIYRMHLLLTPEQRVKLDALRSRLEEERKRDDERKRQDDRTRKGRGDKDQEPHSH